MDKPLVPNDVLSEQQLIARIRLKQKQGAIVRTPVPLPSHLRPQEARPAGSMGLGTLLGVPGFQVTDEELTEAIETTVHGEVPDPSWDNLTKQMIRASCAFFAQEVLTGPATPPYNGKFFISEHHEEWDALVTSYDRICVLAPRDHGKTFFFNFAYPLWKASIMPWGKGFILSATAPQAERILEDIIAEVEGNPELRWLIPSRKDSRKWSSRYVRFSNGHRIYARGFGTRVRGFHPDYIVSDDVLNDETAYSEMVRRKQIDYFYNAVTNMIVPGGQIVVVGTPFHQDDLYGDLEQNEEYEFRKYQAVSPKGKALWPERYSMDEDPPAGVASLPRKKREIGSIRFTREFMVEPVADDMSLFPTRLFRGDPIEQFNIVLGMPAEFWEKAGVTRFMGVDFAMSSNVSADFTVVWTMGLDGFGNRWIIDIQRAKGLPYQEQLSLINSTARKYDPALVFLEDNQMQRIFGDELIRTSDLPIRKFTTTGIQKNALDKGVPSLRVLLENGKFRIPRGDRHSVEMTDIWISEMKAITFQDGKIASVGGHDDMVMACWICDQCIRHGGFQFSFGEEEYEGSLDDFMAELTGQVAEGEDGVASSPENPKGVSGAGGPGSTENADNPENPKGARGTGSAGSTENVGALPGPRLSQAREPAQELQGEDLLRALVKRQFGGRHLAASPPDGNGGQRPRSEPGLGDLVDEGEFW